MCMQEQRTTCSTWLSPHVGCQGWQQAALPLSQLARQFYISNYKKLTSFLLFMYFLKDLGDIVG